MISKLQYHLYRLSQSMSFRAALYCALAIFTVILSYYFGFLVPDVIEDYFSSEALTQLLKILSSSMLVVVTFSLSIIVTAYSSVSKDTTPRATQLLIEDDTSQTSISIFLSSFIFSVVALVSLSTNYFPVKSKIILFAVSVTLLFLVVWTIIRWLDRLRRLGRVNETIKRIEKALLKSLLFRAKHPTLKSKRYGTNMKSGLHKVFPDEVGYVQVIDVEGLANIANEYKIKIKIDAEIGDFTNPKEPLVSFDAEDNDFEITKKLKIKIRNKIIIGSHRSFEGDPRFGFVVLSEVSSKALSPGINDPGTAISVISTSLRCFSQYFSKLENDEIKFENVFVKPLEISDLVDDAFLATARDGRSFLEVMVFLRKGFEYLESLSPEFKEELVEIRKIHSEYLNNCGLTQIEKTKLDKVSLRK